MRAGIALNNVMAYALALSLVAIKLIGLNSKTKLTFFYSSRAPIKKSPKQMKLYNQKDLPNNCNETVEYVEYVFEVGMFVHVEAHNSNFGEDVEDKPNIEGQK